MEESLEHSVSVDVGTFQGSTSEKKKKFQNFFFTQFLVILWPSDRYNFFCQNHNLTILKSPFLDKIANLA